MSQKGTTPRKPYVKQRHFCEWGAVSPLASSVVHNLERVEFDDGADGWITADGLIIVACLEVLTVTGKT